MITPLHGWTWELRRAGIRLRPQDRGSRSVIWYVERLRPIEGVTALVARAPRPRGWREDSRTEIEPFVTDEGEYAAQVTLSGSIDGAPAVQTLAFVFGDDFVARLIGVAAEAEAGPSVVAATRQLARLDTHLLGVRRRRFVYQPPEGAWHGYLMPPFHARWLNLDYPRDPTSIVVLPALPGGTDPVLEVLLASGPGLPRDELPTAAPVVATAGLSGLWYAVEAHDRCWDVVVHGDDRYAYPLAMSSTPATRARHLPAFTKMAGSVESIPRGLANRPAAASPSLAHWAE
jgi:hypothetical protein